MKIAIAGTGYVGLSNAILLSQHHKVTAVDVIQEKVDMVNRKESPIVDDYIEDYLAHKDLDLTATMDGDSAYRDADLIVIAAPTNYDTESNHFDTSAVEAILSQIQRVGSKAIVVIKSTIPIGYTQEISAVYPDLSILFAPEFLREGKALYDNLYPSRIIVGIPKGKEALRPEAEKNLQPWNRKALSARTSRSSSQDLLKQSPSNFSPTPSSPFALPTSMKSTPMPKKRA